MSAFTIITHLNRLAQILNILFKYGLEDIIAHTEIIKKIPPLKKLIKKKKLEKITQFSRAERIRMSFEELGPTFIKFGQLLSNRPDIISQEYIKELEKLQDNVPPFSTDDAIKIIESELSTNIYDLFSDFNKKPVASATIAQVHIAKLKSGKEVAIKIQRPNIKKIIKTDIDILKFLITFIENRFKKIKKYQFDKILKEFEKSILKELDFLNEKDAIKRFKQEFKKNKKIYLPVIFDKYCSSKILITEHIKGIKISDIKNLQKSGINTEKLTDILIDLYFEQIFTNSFFHADPHPGNLFVLSQEQICFIDFGIIGYVFPEDKELLASLVIAIEKKETYRLIRILKKISTTPINNIDDFKYELNDLINDYYYKSLNEIKFEEIFMRFRNLIFTYNISIPSNFFLLIKTVNQVEGLCRKLNPGFDLFSHLNKYTRKIIFQKINPYKNIKNIIYTSLDFIDFFKNLPYDAKELLSNMKEGKMIIHLEHHKLEEFIQTLDSLSNKIILAIILSAMIVASSMIILSDIPPKWQNIPVIGLAGYTISLFLSILLIVLIFIKNLKKK